MPELQATSISTPITSPGVGAPASTPAPLGPLAVPREQPREDVVSLRSLFGQTSNEVLDTERQMLVTEREVIEAGRKGLRRADSVLGQAQQVLSDPSLDQAGRQQRLLTLGAQIAQVAETTQAHSAYPLINRGEFNYPHVDITTFTLFGGSSDEALVEVDPFLPTTSASDADLMFSQARQRIGQALDRYDDQRDHLDATGVSLAIAEFDAHPYDSTTPPPVPTAATLSAGLHQALDPFQVVDLVAPPGAL